MMVENRYHAIVEDLYGNISSDIIEIIEDPDISDFLTILEVICRISAMVEILKIGERPIRGAEKKQIVQKFGRFLIEKHCKEDLQENVLEMYDACSAQAIETVIHFAKNNKVMRRATKCASVCC